MQPDAQDAFALVRRDFDRIAALPDDGWDHNTHYHRYLLNHLPPRCGVTLDVGCGTGTFARVLARHAEHVLALDLSPCMIAVAQARLGDLRTIDFQVADALRWDWPAGRFDCIASITTLHHLPLEAILARMRHALADNGTLLILDLYQAQGLGDLLTSAVATPLSIAARLARTGHLRRSSAARAAWAEHARSDTYPTIEQVRRVCTAILPGARVRRHLFWRYSIVWRKAPTLRPPHL